MEDVWPASGSGRGGGCTRGTRLGEGWEYPFRLSENGTVSGGNTPEATSTGRKLLTTPTKFAPFYTSLTFLEVPCGSQVFPGGRGRHEVFQGAYTAGERAPLLRRPIVFGCAQGTVRPNDLRICSELQAQPGGCVGRCSSVQEGGETDSLPQLVDVLCEVGDE
jgi:hypothetical protein